MIFILICKDKPGHLQTRLDNRPAHLEYLQGLVAKGLIPFAGPFIDGAGQPKGSMVAVRAENRAEAEAIAAADPYAKAGLFESVTVEQWNWTINNPETA